MSKIILMDEKLSLAYTPSLLPCLEEQKKALRESLRRGDSTFFTGPPGTGKTALAKYFARNLQEGMKSAYIDCRFVRSSYVILQHVTFSLGLTPRSGVSTADLLQDLSDYIESGAWRLWLIIDDFPIMAKLRPEGFNSLLEASMERGFILSLLSYEADAYASLPSSTTNRVNAKPILFRRYSEEELMEILNARVKEAFKPDSVDGQAIELIAREVAETSGNARTAIFILRQAAILAENEDAGRVSAKHAELAIEKVSPDVYWQEVVKTLPMHAQLVVAAIAQLKAKDERVSSGNVYRTYTELCKELNIRPRTFMRFSSEFIPLVSGSGIIYYETSYGRRGRSRIMHLHPQIKEPESILKAILEPHPLATDVGPGGTA